MLARGRARIARQARHDVAHDLRRAVEENVWPLIAAGKCKPVIYKTFPLREAAAAHALMESSQHIGKIVLTN